MLRPSTRRKIWFPHRSLRHGHNPKVTWYHPECAMKAFLACSAKSRVVEKVEDIDEGWDALSDTNKAFIRSVIDGAPKSRRRRGPARPGPSPPIAPPAWRYFGSQTDAAKAFGISAQDVSMLIKEPGRLGTTCALEARPAPALQ